MNDEYQIEKPLTVPRTTLIKKIEDTVAKRKAEAKAEHDKTVATLQARLDEVRKALENNPLGLLAYFRAVSPLGDVHVSDASKGVQGFADYIADRYKQQDAGFNWEDPQAEKLLSVLNAAVDENLAVYTDSNFYDYL